VSKFRNWLINNFTDLTNKLSPCKCCPNRTELSVCRNKALKENWESIQRLVAPFHKRENIK